MKYLSVLGDLRELLKKSGFAALLATPQTQLAAPSACATPQTQRAAPSACATPEQFYIGNRGPMRRTSFIRRAFHPVRRLSIEKNDLYPRAFNFCFIKPTFTMFAK